MRLTMIALAAVTAAAALAPAAGHATTLSPIQEGRRAWLKYNCYGCHGANGAGGMGPNIQHQEAGDVSSAMNGDAKEGGMIFIDAMTILKGAKNVENAYTFINFILKPENLAKIYDAYGYPGILYPKTNALRKVAPRYTAAELTKHEVRGDVGEKLSLYESAYEELKSSK